MELLSLALVAGAVGVSAYVVTRTEELVDAVEHKLKPAKDRNLKHRLVVDHRSRDKAMVQADLTLD